MVGIFSRIEYKVFKYNVLKNYFVAWCPIVYSWWSFESNRTNVKAPNIGHVCRVKEQNQDMNQGTDINSDAIPKQLIRL